MTIPPKRGRPAVASRPLNPSTEKHYRQTLSHCFGDFQPPYQLKADLSMVSPSRMVQVKAAVRWACRLAGLDPEPLLEQIPQLPWAPKLEIAIPAEAEALNFEAAAVKNLPPGRRAAALLPLSMGLRATEVLTLTRDSVQRGFDHGELRVLRKGGKEQLLPCKHAEGLLEELLTSPKASALRGVRRQMAEYRAMIQNPLTDYSDFKWSNTVGGRWETVGEIFSTGQPIVQYHSFHEAIRRIGREIGINGLRPHKLRHVFATRMIKRGAPLPVVQWYLGHKNITTTMLYVHMQGEDAIKYLR